MSKVPSMYVSHEKKQAEIERLLALDLVSRQEVEAAVTSFVTVQARVEAVARIVSNLEETYRGVEQYDWYMRDFHISLSDDAPRAGMEHLKQTAVTVRLYARRNGSREEESWLDRMAELHRGGSIDDGTSYITRQVEFPIRYLTSDDWLDDAKAVARRHEAFWLRRNVERYPNLIVEREKELEDLRARHASEAARLSEIDPGE